MKKLKQVKIALLTTTLFWLPFSALTNDFKSTVRPFLQKYCFDCHDKETQKGDVALHDLTEVTYANAGLWKRIWEQVALSEMPPRKKTKQPENILRQQVSDWITEELSKALEPKGGFTQHLRPAKGNHLNHDLLFGTQHKNLKPSSTPARTWQIHPMEHIVKLNELLTYEPRYDPAAPGKRTRGDHIVPNLMGEHKIYFGLDRHIGHIGDTHILSKNVRGFRPVLAPPRDHGLRDYPLMHRVNASDATHILRVAELILKFMANGPEGHPTQFADSWEKIPKIHRKDNDRGNIKLGIFYNNEVKRPLTPVYDLMKNPGISDARLIAAINFLFESLTLRKPSKEETSSYLGIVKKSIQNLGKEKGVIPGLSPIFVDPQALFRSELAETGTPDKYGRVMLQGQELMLAINHAFCFIMPDNKLKKTLSEGKLKSKSDVKREVTRILNDDRIRKPRILQFFKEYFDYERGARISKNMNGLREHHAAMFSQIANTDRLIELILQEDKNVLKELLTTDRVIYGDTDEKYFRNLGSKTKYIIPFKLLTKKKRGGVRRGDGIEAYNASRNKLVNEIFLGEKSSIYVRISQFYRDKRTYEEFGGEQIKTLSSLDKNQRMGILTHPVWLVSHSNAMGNDAIQRGKWVRERLLGDAVPDVPITVDAVLPDEPRKSLRHRMRVTREAECWRCHKKMDPLGLPFEMYNDFGNYLGTRPDASGEIIHSGDTKLDGPVTNALDMIKKLAASERVEQVFVRHVFRYWMGRNETLNDAPILQAAHKAYIENNGSMKALLTSLLTSDAFLYRTRQK